MSSSSSSNQEFDLTMEECERLKKAFKDEEFRKMFAEYAEEIANPENKAIYEEEIRQMEQERGMDIKFVNPEPGHVLKTVLNGSTKAFINICKNVHVGIPSHEKKDVYGKCGVSWSIPHIFAPPRDDLTKTKQNCKIFDFVIHPDTYRMSETNQRFRQMVHDLAVDGIEKMFNVTLDRKNLKQLKMKFMGHKTATVIRNKIADAKVKKQDDENDGEDPLSSFPYPYSNETSSERTQRIAKNENNENATTSKDGVVNDGFTIPKYEMKHQSDVDLKNYANEMSRVCTLSTRPDKLIMSVKLPLLSSAASLELDVFEKSMKLISTKPAKYKLEISLPYPVDENLSSAKFDKLKHELMITMPVI
ncbi:hypothetical protein HELRODRAFT_64915, partial [Helobdella robusta]|uniref:Protein kintoun n=1 Tax=Helobdella robusta TaxID=6412 RepID=T1FY12_HELRO